MTTSRMTAADEEFHEACQEFAASMENLKKVVRSREGIAQSLDRLKWQKRVCEDQVRQLTETIEFFEKKAAS